MVIGIRLGQVVYECKIEWCCVDVVWHQKILNYVIILRNIKPEILAKKKKRKKEWC